MSQMREITRIIQNSNSDASEKLTNGFKSATHHGATLLPPSQATQQYSLTSTTKSDRNNNNVMKKSMPPPIPPKKHLKNGTAKTNTDRMVDNSTAAIAPSNIIGTSQTTVINHVHGPNASTATSNEFHKLSQSVERNDGKGHHHNATNNLNGIEAASAHGNGNVDLKTASGLTGIASSDNHKKLNDDVVVASTTEAKSGHNSGTSHHCDNGMTITCLIRFYLSKHCKAHCALALARWQ